MGDEWAWVKGGVTPWRTRCKAVAESRYAEKRRANAENDEITVENDEIIGPAGTKDTAETLDSRFVTRLSPMRNIVGKESTGRIAKALGRKSCWRS